jgi:branched-chain amino acid transport system permease protein
MDGAIFLQQVVNGMSLGGMYALIAIGYTMVYGVLRLINFAHADVMMVGAFSTLFFFLHWATLRGSRFPDPRAVRPVWYAD